MAEKEAVKKWSDAEGDLVKADYLALKAGSKGPIDFASLEEKYGRSKRSIVGKLVNLKVYETPTKVAKPVAKEVKIPKAQLLAEVAELTGINVEGLASANIASLSSLVDFIRKNKGD